MCGSSAADTSARLIRTLTPPRCGAAGVMETLRLLVIAAYDHIIGLGLNLLSAHGSVAKALSCGECAGQLAPLFGVSKSAADRIIDHLGPMLALQPRKRFAKDTVLIVDGTLAPTRDHAIAEQSKNYRYSINHQVVIDADTAWSSWSAGRSPGTATTAKRGRSPVPRPQSARPPRSPTAATPTACPPGPSGDRDHGRSPSAVRRPPSRPGRWVVEGTNSSLWPAPSSPSGTSSGASGTSMLGHSPSKPPYPMTCCWMSCPARMMVIT
ncbi:hypothetical protein FBY22_4189 [Streptomyces sp. SLBN-31]|nr:hypothetical protein FBY22_4189 [Streptomyces sp. SLBN-31]